MDHYDLTLLRTMTLNQVALAYERGLVAADVVETFLVEWNATPGRFGVARLESGTIRIRGKEGFTP